MFQSRYAKLIVAILGSVAVAIASALTDNHITIQEWVQVIIQATTIAGVWTTANVPSLPWAKALIAGILGAANLAISLVTDGLTGSEVLNLVIAALTAAGVWSVGPPVLTRPLPSQDRNG